MPDLNLSALNHSFPILVAIETDATRYHGEHASRPRLLGRGEAEQVLAHLASDLGSLVPGMRHFSLCLAGALYDQTQVLRPGYPVFHALRECLPVTGSDEAWTSRLIAIGAVDGQFPAAALQPAVDIPPGMLQLLPLMVSGPTEEAGALEDSMEHLFMDQGQLSAHSAKGLEAAFGIASNHARFMTLTDLQALLRMQLEHFGFLGLWQLLDAAMESGEDSLEVRGREGQRFRWDAPVVRAGFETFDYWASQGCGREAEGDADTLAEAYIDWTRGYRQYVITLEAHGIPVQQYLVGQDDHPLEGSFLIEEQPLEDVSGLAAVTEHVHAELGTLAVSVLQDGKQLNFYPIRAEGLNELHAVIREAGHATGGIAFPGNVLCNPQTRRLVPEAVG